MTENLRNRILFALILLTAIILRFWAVDWGLPYTYQMEEYKVIKYALKMGGGDLNPHFFEYPSLYLYFMLCLYGGYFVIGKVLGIFAGAQAFAVQFVKDPTVFYVIGRSAEALFGVGVVILVYRIGKKIYSEKAALFGAFFVAILPEFINKACFTKGDMAAVFLGLLFWLAAYGIFETGKMRYYVLSGIVLGLAVSTKYFMAPLGILIPLAHFLKPGCEPHSKLLLSLFLIPVAFLAGTPYALLSYKEFSLFFSNQAGAYSNFAGSHMSYPARMLLVTQNYLRLTDRAHAFLFGSYGIGFLAVLGMVFSFKYWDRKTLMVLVPLAVYWLIVGRYHNPAAGYLQPVLPLFALLGGAAVIKLWDWSGDKKYLKACVFIGAGLVSISAFGESAHNVYSYTLKDTRTTSKEWIEANIPPGAKILTDLLPNSPPLEMTKGQIERFYSVAVQSDHYKKEYFKLKLDSMTPELKTYEVWLIKRSAAEIGSLPYQVEEAQKVQDLIDVEGDGKDLARLKAKGIATIVVNRPAESDAERNIPRLAAFYKEVSEKAEILKTFEPQTLWQNSPAIKIYRVQ